MKPRLTKLTPEQVAQVLSAAGGQPVMPDMVAGCIERGAPTNGDGTINLITYTAWLVLQFHGRSA